jgi:hypothetical protein
MTKHPSTIADDRPLTQQETEVLRWLLDHGKPSAAEHIGEVGRVRVVSRCGCGCASVDFIEAPRSAMEILSDHQWQDQKGRRFGAFAFAKEGKLAGVEVWSIDGLATPKSLPDTSLLTPVL